MIDLASGTGLSALDAAQRVGPEGAVVGVDLTDAMLAVVRPSKLGSQVAVPCDATRSVALHQQRSPRLVSMLRLVQISIHASCSAAYMHVSCMLSVFCQSP